MTNQSFSLRELISVIVLAVLLLVLCFPLSDDSLASSRRMQNSTQLRGIHQGLVTYANSNRNWYPGIDRQGQDVQLKQANPLPPPFGQLPDYEDITVEGRYWKLLEGDFFTPEYAISPIDNDPAITEWSGVGSVMSNNYSFAMLQLPPAGERRSEWSQTLNGQAVVLADRNIGTPSSTYGYYNSWTTSKSTFGCTHGRRQPYLHLNHWVGNLLWNDNHVAFESTDTLAAHYGVVASPQDELFVAAGNDDALLIHTGN